jgi:hypothetical protein
MLRKPKKWKPDENVAESSKEGYGSKEAILLMVMVMMR